MNEKIAVQTTKYLSDDELSRLIESVETEGLIQAPANLQSEVLGKIDEENLRNHQKNKVIEFYRYSAKVVFSIAAALLLMTIAPHSLRETREIPSKEEVTTLRQKDFLITNIENFFIEMGGFLNETY